MVATQRCQELVKRWSGSSAGSVGSQHRDTDIKRTRFDLVSGIDLDLLRISSSDVLARHAGVDGDAHPGLGDEIEASERKPETWKKKNGRR